MAANQLVFLGTYTDYSVLPHFPRGTKEGDGIVVARWRETTKSLEPLHTVPVLNPAFMKHHPRLNVLYVLSECIHTVGKLSAFAVDPTNGAMTLLGSLDMTGRSTCYISFDKDAHHAIISNYWDGIMNVVKLDERTGAPLAVVQEYQQSRRETFRQVVDREDHWKNRQDGPHAHCNVFHPTYKWLFVPDLGDNCIHQYGYSAGRITHQAHIPVDAGDGPRHFVFHPTLPIAYSGCELRNQVQVFSVDASNPEEVRPRITPIQRISTLPDGWSDTNYVGEIKIDADGRHVYVSNRGHNSIACFTVDPATGLLTREGVDSTLGKCPRHFGLSLCGGYAVVGDQDDDVVKVFNICPDTGRLTDCVDTLDVPTPNFVLFRPDIPATTTTQPITSPREACERAVSDIRVASPVAVAAS